jgi:hypothetical protein
MNRKFAVTALTAFLILGLSVSSIAVAPSAALAGDDDGTGGGSGETGGDGTGGGSGQTGDDGTGGGSGEQ